MPEHNYTIAVDFDGVIHSYTSPWISEDVIPDPPVDGAIDWLNRMAVKFKIVVFTTRGRTVEGRDAVIDYLTKHGYRSDVEAPEVTDEKPPALVYVDDRAYRFTGANFPSGEEIHRLRPWNKEIVVTDELEPKRDVIRDCINANPHSPVTADAILNALHVAGWAVVPRA